MSAPEFDNFRLVGGTSLSLQLGHRLSVNIDLFSDAPYGSIDLEAIDRFVERTFTYADHFANLAPAMPMMILIRSVFAENTGSLLKRILKKL